MASYGMTSPPATSRDPSRHSGGRGTDHLVAPQPGPALSCGGCHTQHRGPDSALSLQEANDKGARADQARLVVTVCLNGRSPSVGAGTVTVFPPTLCSWKKSHTRTCALLC